MSEGLSARVLDALVASVDREALDARLARLGSLGGGGLVAEEPAAGGGSSKVADAVVSRIVLSDILDDAILGARPGEASYPLRVLLGTLGDELDQDLAFALACGLNFYFRVAMEEEAKLFAGIEVSRLYYRYATERPLDADLVPQLSPLLARLMSTELENLSLEAVDATRVFDSTVHERAPGSAGASAKILAPKSFLCRVVSNGRIRAKASVRT